MKCLGVATGILALPNMVRASSSVQSVPVSWVALRRAWPSHYLEHRRRATLHLRCNPAPRSLDRMQRQALLNVGQN